MLQKLLTLTKISVKAGLCGGALYITKEQGVWGNIQEGEAAYYRLKNLKLKELLGDELHAQVPALELPQEVTSACDSVSGVANNLPAHYNKAIVGLCEGIETLPQTVENLAEQAKQSIEKIV